MHRDELLAETQAHRDRAARLADRARIASDRAKHSRFRYIERRTTFLATHASATPPVVRQVLAVVSSRIAQRPTLARLGSIVGLSPCYLNVMFRRCTGMTIHEYATSLRMLRAAQAIACGMKIEAVAHDVGYRSRQSFYRQFKASFGMTPGNRRDR